MTLAGLALAFLLAAPAARAAPQGELVVCDDVTDPLTLDPQREFSEKNHTIVQQMFEGLVRFGPKGEVEPALAESWKRIDDRTIQFKLRQGVAFHDGEPFDAESVKSSVNRYLDPATGFPALGFIASLDHVDVIDPLTVNLVTKYPDGLLLNRLAGFIVMVPPRYYGSQPPEALRKRPIGSGPFRFKSWTPGKSIELEANPRYWSPGYPRVARLTFRFVPPERQVNELLAGRIDLLTNLPGTRTLEVQSRRTTSVLKQPTFYTVAANFNTGRKPLSDERVREAINLAVDRQALVRYDTFGNGIPIGTLSLPGEFGHDGTVAPYAYDLERSRELLRAAGYPEGFTLKALLKKNAERTGKILASQLAQVGIRLSFTVFRDNDMFDYFKDKSRWDMAVYDCPDPMYHAFFIRSIFLAGASPFSLSADAGLDDRLDRLVAALEPDRQRQISEELDRYIRTHNLAAPTYQRVRTYGIRRGVQFEPAGSGMPYFYATSIESATTR